ncbi:MAG: hypothetical protein QGF71_07670 [Rhodospirillales bacterium]|nr:hypothetical protein [Rhodospirillales bacterium]
MTCKGKSYVTYLPPFSMGCAGQRGKADLTCDDGRVIDANWKAHSCTTGIGKGADQKEGSFTFMFGLNKEAAEKYVRETLPAVRNLPRLSNRRVDRNRQRNTQTAETNSPPSEPSNSNNRRGISSQSFPERPVFAKFSHGKMRPDDIAIIVGNANYTKKGKDIPNVTPAYADAEGIKRYVIDALGIRQDNILYIRDTVFVDLVSVFGNEGNHKGQLFKWITPASPEFSSITQATARLGKGSGGFPGACERPGFTN